MNTSSAYDFKLFEKKLKSEREKELAVLAPVQTPVVAPTPKVRVLTRGKNRVRMLGVSLSLKVFNTLCVALSIAVCMGVCMTLISQQARIDTLNRNIERNKGKIREAQAETIRLQAEIDSAVSLNKIEEVAANEYGLVPIQSNQVEYIDLSEGDRVILCR